MSQGSLTLYPVEGVGGSGPGRSPVSTTVKVSSLPTCDLCKQVGQSTEAAYDGKTVFGPWANMCEPHFQEFGVGLGTGRGQRLVQS